ncbi:hypothetical protein TPPAVE_204 [Candidatus Tremblaya phenacola PAVE]|nr:hypothetical protein TPPAVE_204 [Candidatus Tremblaya phenacola PAVE]
MSASFKAVIRMLFGKPLRWKADNTISWLRLFLTKYLGILFEVGGCFCEVLCYQNQMELNFLQIRSVVALGSYKYLTSVSPNCLLIRTNSILICLKRDGQQSPNKIEMIGGRAFCFVRVNWQFKNQIGNFQKSLTDCWGLLNSSWEIKSGISIRPKNKNNGPAELENRRASQNQNVVQTKAINQLGLCSDILRGALYALDKNRIPFNQKTSVAIYHLQTERLKSLDPILAVRLMDSSNAAMLIQNGPPLCLKILLRSNRTKMGQLIGSLSSKMLDALFLFELGLLRGKRGTIQPNLFVLVLGFLQLNQQLTSSLTKVQKTGCQRYKRNSNQSDWRAEKSEEDTKIRIAESLSSLQSDWLLSNFQEIRKKDPFGLLKRIRRVILDLTKHALPFCPNTMISLFQLSWISSTKPKEINALATFLKEETMMVLKAKKGLGLSGRSDFMTFEDISSNLKANNQNESASQICLLQTIGLRLGGVLISSHFKLIAVGSQTDELITNQKREGSGLHELILKVGSLSEGHFQFRGAVGPSVTLSPLHSKICFLFGSSFLKRELESIQTTTKLALLMGSRRLLDLAA